MQKKFFSWFDKHILDESVYYERYKVAYLSTIFFCVVGAYTLAKELQNSLFYYVVGREYIPAAQTIAMFVLIPMLFVYNKLVDKVYRYQLLCIYSGLFAVLGFIFVYFVGDPVVGIANTATSPYRIFGWLFYFFVEGYAPFVVSVCWAFTNSVSSPQEAKNNYGIVVAGSSLGGAVMAGLAWILLTMRSACGGQLFTDVVNYQILLGVSSCLLAIIPLLLIWMQKKIPHAYLHGYEAVYRLERQKERNGRAASGMFAGVGMFLKYPYVLGIFGMSFFYEVFSTVFTYLSVSVAASNHNSMSGALSYLLEISFFTQMSGFLLSLFGTSFLFKRLGVRWCLLLVPGITGCMLMYFLFNMGQAQALMLAFVALRVINYSFSRPLRESLYIPTVKEIRFKSKSWIDAFGTKFAKSSGSAFNVIARLAGPAHCMPVYSGFFVCCVALWVITALMLGRRFEVAVGHDEVIGSDVTSA
jgi:AAA family ATP:ADP antiporter